MQTSQHLLLLTGLQFSVINVLKRCVWYPFRTKSWGRQKHPEHGAPVSLRQDKRAPVSFLSQGSTISPGVRLLLCGQTWHCRRLPSPTGGFLHVGAHFKSLPELQLANPWTWALADPPRPGAAPEPVGWAVGRGAGMPVPGRCVPGHWFPVYVSDQHTPLAADQGALSSGQTPQAQ